jgi:glycosyltransferase involved in cell wall biosynthesis
LSSLTVFSVIRNGIRNGYPFVEAYGSWLGYCDRVVVVDGGSEDGTRYILEELASIEPSVDVVSRPWPPASSEGSAIAEFTNRALDVAREGATRLMYVQADEIYTKAQRGLVGEWSDGALEFSGCVNFWNAFDTVVAGELPAHYIRLFPASAEVRSVGDGFTFEVRGTPVERSAQTILHYGWCFPINILNKHVSHARLYRDDPAYRVRGILARLMLSRRAFDRHLLDALAPQYRPVRFDGEHPACMRHLLRCEVYDPYIGLERLRNGVRW